MKENYNESLIEIIPDECLDLIPYKNKKEKYRLINVFDRLKTELQKDDGEKITDVYKVYSSEEKNNKRLRKDKNKCLLAFLNFIILPLFSIANLIGIFSIISIKDLLFNLFVSSLKCQLTFLHYDTKEFINQTNFFNNFYNESLKISVDFNLLMFWSFIGLKCLKSCGFRKTSVAFLILNIIMILTIYFFDFTIDDNKNNIYTFSKIIAIFFLWIFFGITFGGSTLLSQQALIKCYTIINSNIESDNQKENKNKNNKLLEIDNSINNNGNSINDNNDDKNYDNENEVFNNKDKNVLEELEKIMNKKKDELRKKKLQNEINKTELIRDIKEVWKIETNIIGEQKKEYKKKKSEKNFEDKTNCFLMVSITTILGYFGKNLIIFLRLYGNEIIPNKNFNDNITNITNNTYYYHNYINNNSFNDTNPNKIKKQYFLDFCSVYILFIIFSIILYSIFKCCALTKKEEIEEKFDLDYKISNKGSFSSHSYNESKTKIKLSCYEKLCVWKIFFEIFNFLFYLESTIVHKSRPKTRFCKLCGETIKNYCDNACCNVINCRQNKLKCCCCCCCDYNEDDYDKDIQCFCYCYQEKGCCSFIDKFITNETQKEILPCMILYFFLNLITIGSEKEFSDYKDIEYRNKLVSVQIYIFLISFFTTILIYIFFSTCIKKQQKKIQNEKVNSGIISRFMKNSNFILVEEYYLFFYTSSLSFFSAIIHLEDKGNKDEIESYIYKRMIIYYTILMKRYFFFSLNYYCTSISESKRGNEMLLSQSTLITIYLFINNIIISFIQRILFDNNENNYDNLYRIQLFFSIIFVIIFYFLIINNIIFFLCKKFKLYYCVEGICLCHCCCCNEDSICHCCYCHCCEENCSYCDCCDCECWSFC